MSIATIILAAGQGTRMQSRFPKVLHRLANKTLLQWVIDAAHSVELHDLYVVIGHGGEHVQKITRGDIHWIEQTEQLGTGHAVQQAMPSINTAEQVLVLYGDTPLISTQTLKQFIAQTPKDAVGILTADFTNPSGLGRIVKNTNGEIIAIVEQKDASAEQLKLTEINTGIMLLPTKKLNSWLQQLNTNNAQGELYLTDVIAMAVADKIAIKAMLVHNQAEVSGVNTRKQLAELEREYQLMNAENLLEQGVTIIDPKRFDLRGELECGRDVTFDINVIIEGKVKIADGVQLGPNVILKDVSIDSNTEIIANSIIEGSVIGKNCCIGPFARLRPGTVLADNVKVGNFVETKKVSVDSGSKLPHLSYIGDAVVGKNVNIGAGTITCNYNGVEKFITTIEDNVFIGSNSQLIAPVTIEKNAFVGAGSSISKNAPAGKLTIARARQITVNGWQPPKKKD